MLETPNLVRLYAEEIVKGNWPRERVPEQIENDVAEEIEHITEDQHEKEEEE